MIIRQSSSTLNVLFRVRVALGVLLVAFLLLGVRLWYLQVLKGHYFRVRSENNLLRTVYVSPPRGLILDRNGTVLAANRPAYDIEFVAEDCPNPKKTMADLAQIVGQPAEELIAKLGEQKRRRFEPKVILADVSADVLARVAAQRYRLPGVILNVVATRKYVFSDFAAHTLGYIREVTREQLDNPQFVSYMPGDLVGQFGLESRWENFLRGDRGIHTLVVNAAGVKISERSYKQELIGHNLSLTIDATVQAAADKALAGRRGAIVALDPRNGEVLAISSGPSFDPNIFAREVPVDIWRDLVNGVDKKMNNRAIQGTYAPGSVFKIVTAVAALSEGVIGPEERINCPGFYMFGSRPFRCHKSSGHGLVNLQSAMAQSCDVYFYTVGQRLGVDRIHDYAKRFGLGMLTGIELADERVGIVPSTEWKRNYFKREEDKKWYPGETLSVAIGQGAVTLTPLQIARAVSVLVNGGRLFRPNLISRIESNYGGYRDQDFGKEPFVDQEFDARVIGLVRDSLVSVVNHASGTGHKAQLKPELNIVVAGKTGTAQVASIAREGNDEALKDHAWFAGYAPAQNPEIVVVALLENAGHGGAVAAPVVKAVMEAYFTRNGQPAQTTQESIRVAQSSVVKEVTNAH
jgi:penicillin-binding protein 2